ncbi:MAG TPA: hypothetical protein VGG61_06860 [Gemmataceae bacterium]|jgi:hypothetical protein
MRLLTRFPRVLGIGFLLAVLGGCGGSTDHSGKKETDASKATENLPKPPKPDPG